MYSLEWNNFVAWTKYFYNQRIIALRLKFADPELLIPSDETMQWDHMSRIIANSRFILQPSIATIFELRISLWSNQ